jgi:hypothetical protein
MILSKVRFNRVREFVSNEIIRLILGQYVHTLDVRSVVRDHKILLGSFDARNTMGENNRRLPGTLLNNEVLAAAFARKRGQRSDYYLVIDECPNYVSRDVAEILDGGRKYGLHVILAHQHLHQFKERHPDVYYSTLTNARTKIVFGGLTDEDLDVMAKELYGGELDPDEIKHEIWQTKYEPVESTRVVVSEGESEGESDSYSEISHQSLVEGGTYYDGSGYLNPQSFAVGTGSASGQNRGSSRSCSRSESRVPFIEHHAYKELSGVTFRSLEEQLYRKKAQLKRQPPQHAALLVPGEQVKLIRTPDLRDFNIPDRHVDEFKHACWEAAGCFARPEDAEAEIAALEAKLLEPPVIEVKAPPVEREIHADDDSDLD